MKKAFRMRVKVMALLSVLLGTQAGCLAIGGGYVGIDRFQPVFLTPERATYAKFRYQADEDLTGLTRSEKTTYVQPSIPRVISKEHLLKAWGPPDDKLVEDGRERWIYHDGLRWNGFFIFPGIIIPIPLVIPVGWNTFTIDLQEDTVSSIVTVVNEIKGGGACTFVLVHGGVGCHFGKDLLFNFALKHSQRMSPRELLGSSK